MRKRILDEPIDILSLDEAVYRVKTALLHSKQLKIITLNPEMIVNATKSLEFQAAINNSDLIVADGTGIVWALKLNGHENAVRIPGIELAEKSIEIANELGKKIAIFGGTKEVIEKASTALKEKYPNINIIKAIDGYQAFEKDAQIAEDISSCNPDIVLIALGSPKQEMWINKYSSLFPKSIMIGIGGSLDIWSGKKNRAPEWMRKSHLEWFYRVISEPQRIPRVLKSLPVFVGMVLYFHTKQNRLSKSFDFRNK